MSAIAAVLHLDGRPVARELVVRLTEAMAMNGPDGRDVWVDGAVGLGCASFHTVPEQLHEPMPLVVGRRALTLDGRIDNRAQLRRDCASRGITVAANAGDGAYVMAAYDAWGVDAPAHLVGEWAFVLWDAAHERLLAARDHIARRSLRWWCDGCTLLISSQFPGILEHPDVRAEPNEGMVAEWLSGTPGTMDETLWSGVLTIPGGRRLVCARRGTPRLTRFWDPANEVGEAITSPDEAAEAMRSAVTEAVRAHLRCIGTPEIELSGGWDSSTVALVAHELNAAGRVPDFQLSSVMFPDDPGSDERPYIEAMEQQLGRRSLRRSLALAPFASLLETIGELRHPWARDDWRAIAVSAQHRVTLTGDGGNETLGGMWLSGPAMLANAALTPRRRPAARELLARVARPHVRPLLPPAVRVARSAPLGAWVDGNLSRRTGLLERLANTEPPPRRASLRRRAILAWLDSWTVQQRDLGAELDRGRFVELRDPLHDVRLVRLALRIPARVMGSPHTNARLLHRHAYGSSLPALVSARTIGVGFGTVRVRELERVIGGLGEPSRLLTAGWIDPAASTALIDNALAQDLQYWPASLLYALELWLTSEALTRPRPPT